MSSILAKKPASRKPDMTTRKNKNAPWIERPLFWTVVLTVLFFLLGVGFGARLSLLGAQQQLRQLALTNVNQTNELAEASGEKAGVITAISAEQVSLTGLDQLSYAFTLEANTELFAYIGESTPLLPGENRGKSTLSLADLQPNDMVVVRYAEGQQAVSIQKIR